MIDGLRDRVKADRVIRGGHQKALHAVLPSGFQRVAKANDVGVEDVFPVMLAGLAAKMHHGIDAFGDTQRVLHVRNVCAHEGFAGFEALDRLNVRQAQLVFTREFGSHESADASSGTGDEYCFHA